MVSSPVAPTWPLLRARRKKPAPHVTAAVEGEPYRKCGHRLTVVGREQLPTARVVHAEEDGDRRQIEVRIVRPGGLPVEQHHALAVVDEVGWVDVVVAEH